MQNVIHEVAGQMASMHNSDDVDSEKRWQSYAEQRLKDCWILCSATSSSHLFIFTREKGRSRPDLGASDLCMIFIDFDLGFLLSNHWTQLTHSRIIFNYFFLNSTNFCSNIACRGGGQIRSASAQPAKNPTTSCKTSLQVDLHVALLKKSVYIYR